MKVILLCGGLGTRLREETEYLPKPMVKIGDRPILWHIMKIYSYYGFNDFILCLGYKGQIIRNYFLNYDALNNDFTIELGKQKRIEIHSSHPENGWNVTLADTGKLALKGARLKKVEKYITDDTFMMTYGDGVADVNIKKLLSFHKSHGKIATLTGINPFSRFGELKIEKGRVVSFSEKPKDGKNLASGGFFVFEKKFFDYLSDEDSCDLEIGPLEKLTAQGELMVYRHKGFWACMDTHRDMEYLNKLWEKKQAKWKLW